MRCKRIELPYSAFSFEQRVCGLFGQCQQGACNLSADMTAAEMKAKWQNDKLRKDELVEEHKAKMTPYKSAASQGEERLQDGLKRRQERVALHLLQSKPLTPPIQWRGFKLEELPSKQNT